MNISYAKKGRLRSSCVQTPPSPRKKSVSLPDFFWTERGVYAQARSYPFVQNHGWIRGAGQKDRRSGNKKCAWGATCGTIKPKSIFKVFCLVLVWFLFLFFFFANIKLRYGSVLVNIRIKIKLIIICKVDRTLRGINDGCSRCRCFAIFVTHQIKWIHTHRGESRHTTCLRALMGRSRAKRGRITLVKSPSGALMSRRKI